MARPKKMQALGLLPPTNLRGRIRVRTVRLTGFQAANRRIEQMIDVPVIDPSLMDQAVEALEQGNVDRFLIKAHSNEYWIYLLADNVSLLKDLGLYERGLLSALTASRTNNYAHRDTIPWLIREAEPAKLRAAGQPLPGPGPFRLYRGVAGRGPARRVRGLSWTASVDQARWFARRFRELGDPAVFTVVVQAKHVLAYTNERREEEFLVVLPHNLRPARYERPPHM